MHEKLGKAQLLNDILHEKEANIQLLKDRNEALKDRNEALRDRYEAQLRAVQLKSELAERTVPWLKERGTLTMRGVLGKCLP